MPSWIETPWLLLRDTIAAFVEDRCMSLAAGLAFYTLFSLAPALVLVIQVGGLFIDPSALRGEVSQQIQGMLGHQQATQVQAMLEQAHRTSTDGALSRVMGVGALLVGATAVLVQLQHTLNLVWGLEPDPDRAGVLVFLVKRLLSLGMILVLAFLLLVSLTASALVTALGDHIAALTPWLSSGLLIEWMDAGLSLLLFGVIFAAIFKILPDADVAWRDVGVGALATAVLFVIGKELIGLYLGTSNLTTAYGAASSLAVILVWVYYSSVILFLGAEFTKVWAKRFGKREIKPARGAVRVDHA